MYCICVPQICSWLYWHQLNLTEQCFHLLCVPGQRQFHSQSVQSETGKIKLWQETKKGEVAEEWVVSVRESSSCSSSHVGLRADWTLQWLTITSQGTSDIIRQDGLAGQHANMSRYLCNIICLWCQIFYFLTFWYLLSRLQPLCSSGC